MGCDTLDTLRKEDNDWVRKCTEYEVEGFRPRGLGDLCRKTVKHINCTWRMLWIVVDEEDDKVWLMISIGVSENN